MQPLHMANLKGIAFILIITQLYRRSDCSPIMEYDVGPAAASQGDEGDSVDPWTINRGVCPPVLCGPEAEPVGGGETERSGSELSRRMPQQLKSPSQMRAISYEPVSAYSFFEGDIVLDEEMSERLSRSERRGMRVIRHRRSIIRPVTRLWRYGIIPFLIDDHLPTSTQRHIEMAMRHIENQTCITFRPYRESSDEDYLFYIYQPGCWSLVGKRGGAQYISLGSGCSQFGTALHETLHAVGFWHEQSRQDRDKFVQVNKDNIPPSLIEQFGKREKTESTSRGYAYDYLSVMHYGPYYFSKNENATLMVIGKGRSLGLKIGQRKRLSDLDVAQLRDMYHCNEKEAADRACEKGWKKFGGSCYLFVTSPRKQYGEAERSCRRNNSRLLSIETAEEDQFIKQTLISSYKSYTTWRTSGRLRGGKWLWYERGARRERAFQYTAWAPNHPGDRTSHVLVRFDGSPPRYVWRGETPGAARQLPQYAYPYICEARAKSECVKSQRNGRNYRGTVSYTRDGVTCQRWTAQYPHSHRYLRGERRSVDVERHGLGDHNYCRNPDSGKRRRPWCFTTLSGRRWQYCDIRVTQGDCP